MLHKRKILKNINKWLNKDQCIFLIGARQVGKTSLLHIIKESIDDNCKETNSQSIFYDLEDFETLHYFNESPKNLIKDLQINTAYENLDKIYVFIDEIQYLNDPSHFIKYIYDTYKKKIKLIVSGSSSFYIDKNFKDSLSGRKIIFEIMPLDFDEFLLFRGKRKYRKADFQDLSPNDKREMKNLLEEYSRFGSYPAVVLEPEFQLKKLILKELINSYLKKDVLENQIRYPDKFYKLIKILAENTGAQINNNELANSLDLSYSTVENYLYILEKTFYIKTIKPFYKNLRKELTKMPKIFLLDMGVRNYLLDDFKEFDKRLDKGAFLENLYFKFLTDNFPDKKINYWRTTDQKEIDFIIPDECLAVEIKSKKAKARSKAKKEFLENYPEFDFSFRDYEDLLEF